MGVAMAVPQVRRRAPGTAARVTALGVAVLTIALAGAQFLPGWQVPGKSGFAEMAFVTAFVVNAGVGAVVVWYRPANIVGWIVLGMGFGVVLTGWLTAYAYRGLVVDPGSLPGAVWARWAQSWLYIPAWFGGLTFPLYLVPNGTLPSRRWRPVIAVELVALVVATVTTALAPGPIGEAVPVQNPLGVERLGPLVELVEVVVAVTLVAGPALGIVALVVRWREESGRTRRQLAYVLAAAVVGVTLIVVAGFIPAVNGPAALSALAVAIAMTAPAVGIGLAVVNAGLFDIEVVVSRTLVWAAISTLSLLTYAGVLAATTRWASGEVGAALSVLATAFVAIGLGALRERVEPAIRRRLFGFRDRPYALLTGLGDMTTAPDQPAGAAIATWLKDALKLSYAEIRATGAPADQAEPANAERFALTRDGMDEGTLVVALPGTRSLGAEERSMIEVAARQAVVVLHAHRLTAEVQLSRTELVQAHERERTRIRRDVHDGIGPTLAAVPIQLDVLTSRLDPDDDEARALARRVKDQVLDAVADLRLLIDGLQPSSLEVLGLEGAIRQRVAVARDAGLEVDLVLDDLPDLGPAAGAATLHVVAEALTNAVRHAGGTRARVEVGVRQSRVVIDVIDNGCGLAASVQPGIGLESMRLRATELGGAFRLTRGNLGGLHLHAEIPEERP